MNAAKIWVNTVEAALCEMYTTATKPQETLVVNAETLTADEQTGARFARALIGAEFRHLVWSAANGAVGWNRSQQSAARWRETARKETSVGDARRTAFLAGVASVLEGP